MQSNKCIFAHAVPQKGVDPEGFVVERVKEDIVWLGHSQVVIRRDNEPALAKVVDKVVKVLKDAEGVTASYEGSVPYDPQTNGASMGIGPISAQENLNVNLLGAAWPQKGSQNEQK